MRGLVRYQQHLVASENLQRLREELTGKSQAAAPPAQHNSGHTMATRVQTSDVCVALSATKYRADCQ